MRRPHANLFAWELRVEHVPGILLSRMVDGKGANVRETPAQIEHHGRHPAVDVQVKEGEMYVLLDFLLHNLPAFYQLPKS